MMFDTFPDRPIQIIEQGPAGIGLVRGGTKNQVLIKKSDSDYDVEWVNIEDIIDYAILVKKIEDFNNKPIEPPIEEPPIEEIPTENISDENNPVDEILSLSNNILVNNDRTTSTSKKWYA